MATVLSLPEQRIVLDNISWETYENILVAQRDRSVPRLTYDRGHLEIMSPSAEHERLKETVTLLINIMAEEMGINAEGFGSTTFRREDLARGFEPDTCFYIASLGRVKGKTTLDLRLDPPPDLVIEIDLTSSSLDKFSIFAQLGVPEVWRYDGSAMHIFRLVNAEYVKHTESTALPGLSGETIERFLDTSRTLERLAWVRQVRAWGRDQRGAGQPGE
jgi:Uma2 family endonuclease